MASITSVKRISAESSSSRRRTTSSCTCARRSSTSSIWAPATLCSTAPRWSRRSRPVAENGSSSLRSSKANPPPGGSWKHGRRRTSSQWKSRLTGSRITRSWSGTRRCTDAGRRSDDAGRPETLKFIARSSDSISIRMTVLGVDTIAIVVSDPRKAIEWYRDVLGLDVAYIGPSDSNPDPSVQGTAENPGHWVELGPARPRTRVHLCFMRGETEPGPSGITFITDDIQADYERMRRQGVEFPLPPEKMEWGEWLGQFADLDGNVFDLKQPIYAAEWKVGSPPAKPRQARRLRFDWSLARASNPT